MNIDIDSCQRCGNRHIGLEVKDLPNAADEWNEWAMCPDTQCPVLIATVPGPENGFGAMSVAQCVSLAALCRTFNEEARAESVQHDVYERFTAAVLDWFEKNRD